MDFVKKALRHGLAIISFFIYWSFVLTVFAALFNSVFITNFFARILAIVLLAGLIFIPFFLVNWSKKVKILVAAPLLIITNYFVVISGFEPYTQTVNLMLNASRGFDKSCMVDTDCEMKEVSCSNCSYDSKGDSVNKKYKQYCPLPSLYGGSCAMAEPEWARYRPYCQNQRCKYEVVDSFVNSP